MVVVRAFSLVSSRARSLFYIICIAFAMWVVHFARNQAAGPAPDLIVRFQHLKKLRQELEDKYIEVLQPIKLRLFELEKDKKKYPPSKDLPEGYRKRILITGGAGFVGSHLTDALMMEGHEVTVVDNYFTGRKRNVEHWIGHPNFEMINHDVVEPLFLEVDQIYHLASPASPPHYMYNPIKTIKTNAIGTLNMLGLAKRVRARLLLASTSEVYGDPEVHPQPESYWGHVNTIGPRACYDEGKRVAETMCYAYARQSFRSVSSDDLHQCNITANNMTICHLSTDEDPSLRFESSAKANVEVRIARIFNTFGTRMHMNDGRVVSNFILQALQGKPITIYGEGLQTRSFQYVSDLVDGLIKLMNSNISSPVNLGNPSEHTIKEFAVLIKNRVGNNRSQIVSLEAQQDDPKKRKPDINKAKIYLKWEPKIDLMTGLDKTIRFFRNELARLNEQKEL